MRRAYLDACVLIYYIERVEGYWPSVEAQLNQAADDEARLYLSDLTRLECRVKPLRHDDVSLLARFDAFFSLAVVRTTALDAAVFERATVLRAEHRLKTPDALHLAAAITAGCTEFWTNDNRLAKAADSHLRIVTFAP